MPLSANYIYWALTACSGRHRSDRKRRPYPSRCIPNRSKAELRRREERGRRGALRRRILEQEARRHLDRFVVLHDQRRNAFRAALPVDADPGRLWTV